MNMKIDLEGCDITKELKMIEEGKKPKKPKHDDILDAIRYKNEDDAKEIKTFLNKIYGLGIVDTESVSCKLDVPHIIKVIFRNPATIVFWSDGTKTVVKVQGKERFNKEKGLAMAIAKKALGNKGNYYEEFKKWL